VVRSHAYPQQTFFGHLVAIDVMINQNTRTMAVRANIPNKDQKLLPGGFVEVGLLIGEKHNVTMVPQTAVVDSDTGSFVYKVVNGKAIRGDVQLGERIHDQVIVTQGLKSGEMVVTAGQVKLRDGAPVIIAKSK